MSRDFTGKHYWLVGASAGLGQALAQKMSAAGVELTLSARSTDDLEELAASLPGPAHVLPIDLADMECVAQAVEAARDCDGMISLAGVYWPMKATEWDVDHGVAMADVNFTGNMRLLGHLVPNWVKRGHGHIMLTGSLTAFRGLPRSVGYSATKAALVSLAETMRADLHGTGVEVQINNPGFIRTRLTDKNDFHMPFLMEPEEAADHVWGQLQSGKFKLSFPRLFGWMLRATQFLPDWLYFRLLGAR